MSSQYPQDQGWANQGNASPHSPPQGGAPPQNAWQQYGPQPEYLPVQQQTYFNNNIAAKPSLYPPQSQNVWNQVSPQQLPLPQLPTNAYYTQPATSPVTEPFPNAYGHQQSYQPPPQQTYAPVQQPAPASNEDNWSWDVESSSDSPATSTPNNNWGSQTPAALPPSNSIQSYFQPTLPPSSRQSSLPVGHQVEQQNRNPSALTLENLSGVDSRYSAGKPESPHSYQSGSHTHEIKTERLSPDSNKIPLTTQALREFHKEAYENGPGNQHRLGMEGLTPQWSIESQLSQETVSDDVLSSQVDGSDADDRRNHHLRRLEDGEELQYQPTRVDEETTARFMTLSLTEAENKEVITPEQQRALNVASGVDRRFPQNGYTPRPETIDDNLTHAQGDGSANPPDDTGPPLGGFKLFDKKPSHQSSRPADVFGPGLRTQHSPRPDAHPLPEFNRPESTYPVQNLPLRPPYSEDIYRPVANEGVNSIGPVVAYSLPTRPTNEGTANLESIPDNKERPDLETRGARFPPPSQHSGWYGPDNQEVTPRGDRNQYLETGQLAGQDALLAESTIETDVGESLPPPGLSRLVTGAGHNVDMPSDMLTPPPGLDREVLGRLTNAENQPPSIGSHGTPTRSGLQRMVMGQPTDEPTGFPRMVPGESSSPENQVQSPPPPDAARQRTVGYPRMVTGESSSPEIQVQSSPPTDARVVPGVAREDAQMTTLSIPTSPGAHRSSLNDSPDTQTRNQPQAERSETIGSDHVETFTANPPVNCPKPSSKRRNKERRRDDGSSDERDSGRRPDRERDYYRGRERDVPSSRDRHSVDWDRRRERSPHSYHDDRDRRRTSPDRFRDDNRRRKHMKYSDDEDEDYSDREHSMSGYREDYDRSYSKRDERARSQRPEKSGRDRNDERRDERDKRRGYDRNADRDRDREPRSYDYYRRRGHDEPDDYHDQRSRPSSRNDSSVHDFKGRGLSSRSNIERDRESEREQYRAASKRDKDPYYPQAQTYNYNPMLYAMYQQYYEQLRRMNPAAYADLCRKYQVPSQQGAYSEDRGSVHSGRSSANEDSKDRRKNCGGDPKQLVNPFYLSIPTHVTPVPIAVVQTGRSLDASLLPEEPPRLTPAKFSTAHVKGILTARGQLIKIAAQYPLDGQPATIEIHESLLCCQTTRDQFQNFPGPLIKKVTHKNNVVRFCQQKIKDADFNPDLVDKDSYKLIWELFILMLRQNGTVAGTDIAELLMNQRSAQPPVPSPATSHHSINEIPGQQTLQEEEVTNKFRDMLIYGNTKEALEWAMKHGLWGHALFLASKMEKRTYAQVMARFANGLPMNDPLQTLYQLMSGRQPAAVTYCMDERWGDWRPHLAMILSNQQNARPDNGLKAIADMGDNLGARGSLYAAHFCYLIAQQAFGNYSNKSSKIVLIGSPQSLPFHLFASNEAIFATEVFEFACNLADTDFVLPHLQVYKLIVARRLAEVGMTQEAVHYVEVIANTIMKQPSLYSPPFIREVYDLGDMLKFSDPVYTSSETDGADPDWLQQLLPVLADYQSGLLQHNTGFGGSSSNLTTNSDGPDGQPSLPLDVQEQSWHPQEQVFTPQPQNQRFQPPPMHPNSTPLQQEPPKSLYYGGQQLHDNSNYGGSSTETPNYFTPPPPSQWSQPETEIAPSPATPPEHSPAQLPQTDYYDANRSEAPPSISLPGASPRRQRTVSQSSDGQRSSAAQRRQSNEPLRSASQQQQPGTGWFGGFLTKLSLRPKNQMHLPDDTNPSITYDADKKRWVDQNADDDDGAGVVAPPPMVAPRTPAPTNLPIANPIANPMEKPMPSSGPNMYKMPRGRTLRGSYIDVMNPGDKLQKPSAVPTPDLFPSLSYPNQRAKLFVPPHVEGQEGGMNLFVPNVVDSGDNWEATQHQGLSRWSSTSSLSREVQMYTSTYTTRARTYAQVPGGLSDPVDSMGPGARSSNGALGGTLPRSKRYN